MANRTNGSMTDFQEVISDERNFGLSIKLSAMYYSRKDTGYAYIIALASFLGHVLQYGVVWTVGVFYEVFIETFPDNSGKVALISSMNTAVFYLAGPLASVLTNRFGPRVVCMTGGVIGSAGLILSIFANNIYVLYVTFGIITGFGLGLTYIPVITVLGVYFEKKRSIAIGFAVSGCGVGTFIFPPLIRLFINQFGWKGAMLLLGAISMNLCAIGALLRPFVPKPENVENIEKKPKKTQNELLKEKVKRNGYCSVEDLRHLNKNKCNILNGSVISLDDILTSRESRLHTLGVKGENVMIEDKPETYGIFNLFIFKNIHYLLLCFNNFCMCFGLSTVYVHLSAYASTTGISSDMSALLFSVIGASNFVARFLYGLAGQIPGVNDIFLYLGSFLASGIVTLMCPISQSYAWLVVFSVLFGGFTGSFGALLPQVIIHIIDLQCLTSGYGYLLVFEAAGTLLGAPVAGWLYEWTSIYSSSFYLAGVVIILSSVVMIYPGLSITECFQKKIHKVQQPLASVESLNPVNVEA